MRRPKSWPAACLVVVAAVLGLYVLSFGPACWLVEHKIAPPHGTAVVYYPLVWIGADADTPGAPIVRGLVRLTCGTDRRVELMAVSLGLGGILFDPGAMQAR